MSEVDIKAENKLILREYRALLKNSKREMDEADRLMIRKAFDLAVEAHRPMRRKSGEAYIFHPNAVARIVSEENWFGNYFHCLCPIARCGRGHRNKPG